MRRQALWKWNVATFDQLLVGSHHCLVEHPPADVALDRFGSGGGGEYEPAGTNVRSLRLVGGQLVAEHRQQVDLAHPSVGL